MSELIVNKVANSGLLTVDLESYLPKEEIISFDLKDHLFMGLILKEKDFREALKNMDWQAYADKYVTITCSVDAIIPMWAYMLVASYLQPVAKDIYTGTAAEMQKHLFLQRLNAIDIESYKEQRIVVKGCGDVTIDNYAYAEITRLLLPVVKSIMYGEPCSTVPVYKKK
jgi:LPS O-antigen subunit length determinant protein (WzzB/FepE family)